MTAITDYASLAAAVIDHTTRDDIETAIPRFVQMAEGYLKRRLRTLDMEKTATAPVLAGEETISLPSDLLSIRSIHLEGDTDSPLAGSSPAALAYRTDQGSGSAVAYSRSGNVITLAAAPSEDVSLAITYLAGFTPLTDGSTNWIIEDYPDVYFYGTLAEAYAYFVDPQAQLYEGRFKNAVEELAMSRARDKWGPGLAVPTLVRQVGGAKC